MNNSILVETSLHEINNALETLGSYYADQQLKSDLAVMEICLLLVGERDCAQLRFPKSPDNDVHLENKDMRTIFDTLDLFVVGTEHHRYGLEKFTPIHEFFLYRTVEDWHKYKRAKQTKPLAIVNANRYGIPLKAAEAFVETRKGEREDSSTESIADILTTLLESGEVTETAVRNLMFTPYSPQKTQEGVLKQVSLAQKRGDKLDALVSQGNFPVLEDVLYRLRQFSSPEWQTSTTQSLREYPVE